MKIVALNTTISNHVFDIRIKMKHFSQIRLFRETAILILDEIRNDYSVRLVHIFETVYNLNLDYFIAIRVIDNFIT